jgi:hypothetical protein
MFMDKKANYKWPIHNLTKSKVSKIPKTFNYFSRTISNFTMLDFLLQRDQTSRSGIWQMIIENSSMGLSRLLWTMSDICKVSDGTRVVAKCLRIFFWYTCTLATSILHSQNFRFQITIYLVGNWNFLKHKYIHVCTKSGCTYLFFNKICFGNKLEWV